MRASGNADSRTRQHGTRTCYVHGPAPGSGKGCRCEPCTRANADYVNSVTRQRAYGRWDPWADAAAIEEARDHLRALGSVGVGYKAVARAAGLNPKTVYELRAGRRTRVRRDSVTAILAVSAGARAGHALVDAGDTWRLLEELIAAGMTKRRIARCLGVGDAIQFRRDHVLQRNAGAVKELHDGLWPLWPALRAACGCYSTIQFERRREENKHATRRRRARQAVPA